MHTHFKGTNKHKYGSSFVGSEGGAVVKGDVAGDGKMSASDRIQRAKAQRAEMLDWEAKRK